MSLFKSPLFWLSVLLVVLATVGTWAFCSWGWLRQVEGGESNSATLRNVSLVLGGIIAIWFGVWRTNVADRQAKAAQQQANIAQRQADTTEQGLLSDRYERGASMLSNDVLPVRLAGIYALERLTKEHPEQYHTQIISLLCTFVRNPISDVANEVGAIESGPSRQPREDVQAAMTVIGGRSESETRLELISEFELDLSSADLRGLRLEKANLSGAILMRSDLSGSWLSGADLSNSILGETNLSEARLGGANVAGSEWWSTNLSGAILFQTKDGQVGIDWGPVKGLTQDHLYWAKGDIEPSGLTRVVDSEGVPLKWPKYDQE